MDDAAHICVRDLHRAWMSLFPQVLSSADTPAYLLQRNVNIVRLRRWKDKKILVLVCPILICHVTNTFIANYHVYYMYGTDGKL